MGDRRFHGVKHAGHPGRPGFGASDLEFGFVRFCDGRVLACHRDPGLSARTIVHSLPSATSGLTPPGECGKSLP